MNEIIGLILKGPKLLNRSKNKEAVEKASVVLKWTKNIETLVLHGKDYNSIDDLLDKEHISIDPVKHIPPDQLLSVVVYANRIFSTLPDEDKLLESFVRLWEGNSHVGDKVMATMRRTDPDDQNKQILFVGTIEDNASEDVNPVGIGHGLCYLATIFGWLELFEIK